MTKLTLKIVGDHKMNCGGCEGKVRNAISNVPGVIEASASKDTQLVEISANQEINMTDFNQALSEIGYQAEMA